MSEVNAIIEAAKQEIRGGIHAAVKRINRDAVMQVKGVEIWVEVISTGPQLNREPEYLLGDISIGFKV